MDSEAKRNLLFRVVNTEPVPGQGFFYLLDPVPLEFHRGKTILVLYCLIFIYLSFVKKIDYPPKK